MLCSFIAGLGVALTLGFIGKISIALGILVGILVLIHLLHVYFKTCINVYAPLEKRESEDDDERRSAAFKKVFEKAWFLHFYYDNQK
jgi:hypothetical protein